MDQCGQVHPVNITTTVTCMSPWIKVSRRKSVSSGVKLSCFNSREKKVSAGIDSNSNSVRGIFLLQPSSGHNESQGVSAPGDPWLQSDPSFISLERKPPPGERIKAEHRGGSEKETFLTLSDYYFIFCVEIEMILVLCNQVVDCQYVHKRTKHLTFKIELL